MMRARSVHIAVFAVVTAMLGCSACAGSNQQATPGETSTDLTSTTSPTASTTSPPATATPPARESAAVGALAAVVPRPAVFGSYPEVVLILPGETNAGVAPTFTWQPVDGATTYRLAVLGPEGPLWSWTGSETKVDFALRPGPRADTAPGLEIEPGSWWSVSALDELGMVVAFSELRAVSPGEAPAALVPPGSAAADIDASAAAPPTSAAAAVPPDPCTILDATDVASLIGQPDGPGEPSGFAIAPGTDCEWRHDGYAITLKVDPSDRYDPERWAGPDAPPVTGLPAISWLVDDGLAVKVGWVHEGLAVEVDAYGPNQLNTIQLALTVESRLS